MKLSTLHIHIVRLGDESTIFCKPSRKVLRRHIYSRTLVVNITLAKQVESKATIYQHKACK